MYECPLGETCQLEYRNPSGDLLSAVRGYIARSQKPRLLVGARAEKPGQCSCRFFVLWDREGSSLSLRSFDVPRLTSDLCCRAYTPLYTSSSQHGGP